MLGLLAGCEETGRIDSRRESRPVQLSNLPEGPTPAQNPAINNSGVGTYDATGIGSGGVGTGTSMEPGAGPTEGENHRH
jgi:hypothetical protein